MTSTTSLRSSSLSLVKRGIDASRQRLFVIDGGTALRSAIEEVYGEQAQRCRIHKLRNVLERLPEPLRIDHLKDG